jgi:ABC-2 type transport system permease protein
MLVLVGLVGLFVSCVSYTLALLMNNEYALSSVANLLILPLILLSGITLPLTLAPPLLQILGRLNPFSHAVDASRALATGELMHTTVLPSFILIGILFGLMFALTVRAFRHSVH